MKRITRNNTLELQIVKQVYNRSYYLFILFVQILIENLRYTRIQPSHHKTTIYQQTDKHKMSNDERENKIYK